MKKYVLAPIVCCLFSSTVYAADPFGEPVNCRDEISYKNIFQGPVQCDAKYDVESCEPQPNGFTTTKKTITETLYDNSQPTTKNKMNLYKMVTYLYSKPVGPNACTIPVNVSKEIMCTADIPFSHQETIVTRVCDYKPEAQLAASAGYRAVDIMVFSRDYDGTIVSEELWVDGVKQSSSSTTLEGFPGQSFVVKVVATDNHGYSTSKTQNVLIPYLRGPK